MLQAISQAFKDPRFQLLLDRFKSRMPFFGSRQIANSLHGLGAVNYRGPGPWMEVSVQTQRRIHEPLGLEIQAHVPRPCCENQLREVWICSSRISSDKLCKELESR